MSEQQIEEVKRILLNSPSDCRQELTSHIYITFYEYKDGAVSCAPVDPLFRRLRKAYSGLKYDITELSKFTSSSYYSSKLENVAREAVDFINSLTETIGDFLNNANVILDIYRDVFAGFKYACYNAVVIAGAMVKGERYEYYEFEEKLMLLVDYYVYGSLNFLFSNNLNVLTSDIDLDEELIERVPSYSQYVRDPLEQVFLYATATSKLKDKLKELEGSLGEFRDVGKKVRTYKCYVLQKDSFDNPELKLICRKLSSSVDKDVVKKELERINEKAMNKMAQFFLDLARKGVDPEQFCKTFRPEDVISEEIREYNDVIKKYGIFIFELNLPLKAKKL